MSITTTLAASYVKRWLATQLTAAVAALDASAFPEGVEVALNDLDHETPADTIVIGKVETTPKLARFMGGFVDGAFDEAGEITVDIVANGYGSDALDTVESRGMVLFGLLFDVVRADPTAGGVLLLCEVGHVGIETGWTDGSKSACVVTVQLAYEATL